MFLFILLFLRLLGPSSRLLMLVFTTPLSFMSSDFCKSFRNLVPSRSFMITNLVVVLVCLKLVISLRLCTSLQVTINPTSSPDETLSYKSLLQWDHSSLGFWWRLYMPDWMKFTALLDGDGCTCAFYLPGPIITVQKTDRNSICGCISFPCALWTALAMPQLPSRAKANWFVPLLVPLFFTWN